MFRKVKIFPPIMMGADHDSSTLATDEAHI
jgi:hypothetical protein